MSVARARRYFGLYFTSFGLAAFTACADAPPATNGADEAAEQHAAAGDGEEATGLASLRSMTAGFADIEGARQAGYTEQITTCWYHRDNGGQGYHYGRSELIDGTVSLMEPELVMYEPMPDGSQQFVGIEYIVPLTAWEQPEPPSLLGQEFMRNEQLGLWVLHVWLGKDNPSGLYATWNPQVTCAHAAESEDRA
jgi:hypothetical protein